MNISVSLKTLPNIILKIKVIVYNPSIEYSIALKKQILIFTLNCMHSMMNISL